MNIRTERCLEDSEKVMAAANRYALVSNDFPL